MKLFTSFFCFTLLILFSTQIFAQANQCEGLKSKFSTQDSLVDKLTKRIVDYPNLKNSNIPYFSLPEVQLDRGYCSCTFFSKLYWFYFGEREHPELYFKAFDGDYFHTDCMKCHDCKLRFHSKDKFFRAGHDKTVLICGDCGLKRILNKLTKLFTKNDNNYP